MKSFPSYIKPRISLLFFLVITCLELQAQNPQLVWAEEFEGSTIDSDSWLFESGPTNDNVHFYTDREENATVSDGKLRIIALKESYQGYNFTSAHIRTEKSLSLRYGRIEASIKLPGTKGFVPAFWMLPVDNRYGWWPYSGEIDIMEHPTNEVTKIYGTVHTQNYNLFQGPQLPQGGSIDVQDAESAFHLYAIEWTPEKIDFFVDDQKYYSFENDQGSTATWPFDQPFYIILNLAVGGGWVGTPDQSSVFPSVMEVDFVRVYQDLTDIGIQGMDFVTYNTTNVTYRTGEIEGATYQWSVPGDAEITTGQGSPQIAVNWGIFGGNVEVNIITTGGTYLKTLPVRASSNLLKNSGFEKGVRYWKSSTGYPVRAQMDLREEESHGGTHSIHTTITDAGGNPWDVQLTQPDLDLKGGTTYYAGLMAKSGVPGNQINAAVINTSNFALTAQKQISPVENWKLFEFDFTPSQNFNAAFNVDMGGNTGSYYLDDFILTTEELSNLNLVKNPDFFDGMEYWTLTTLSSAIAEGSAIQGEYAVSISNGGENAWDVFLGQSGLLVEQGYEYTISFDAYAGAPHQITPFVGRNNEPWTVYSGGEPVSISTTRQTYSFTFPMNEPTDPESRLGFDTGGDEEVVYFDNILLRKGGQLSTSANIFNISPGLSPSLRVYPNPVHNLTSFYYTLQKSAQVTLRIFNLNGQEVETLANGFKEQGEHVIKWNSGKHPAGVYLCQLKVDEWSEIRKVILL